MTTFNIPESWLELNIGDIADVIAGGTPKAAELDNFAESGTAHAWLTPADLSKYNKKHISYGKRDLSQKGLDTSSAKLMPKGAILFSSRAPIGYVVVANNEISTNQGFKSFVFTKHVDSSFAYYYLRSIRDVAESRGSGTTFKELSGANAKKLPFILAPLAEQIQIANKTDELLAQVDIIKTRLDAIPAILKRFRQSVLAAAVSGKLTEEWRTEQKNIKIEFESYTVSTDLPDSWRVVPLGDYVENLDNQREPISTKEREQRQGTFPYFGASGQIDTIDGFTHHGDFILIGEDGANLVTRTKPIAFSVTGKVWVNNHAHVLKCKPGYENTYLEHYINSIDLTPWVSGTAQPKLNQKNMNKIPIPVAPKDEQTEIVKQVDRLLSFLDHIEQRVKEAQTRVNNLTQSILAKAFRGELTADWREQNPDLISGENSAEALLEKIKKEREAIEKAKPKKKKPKNSTKKKCE